MPRPCDGGGVANDPALADLGPSDLESLARCAYMLGDPDTYVAALERAHATHLEAGDVLPAVRVAFWIGHSYLFRGQGGQARGWFARAQRLFDESGEDGSERGWLLIPAWLQQMGAGDYESGGQITAGATAGLAVGILTGLTYAMMQRPDCGYSQGLICW